MSRIQILLLLAGLVVVTTGCRSRGNNSNGGWFANSTVAPPPTYSLDIPSLAKNQPYYTPGAAPSNTTLNPNQRAPIPATQQNQDGWRQSGNQQLNGVNAAPANNRSMGTNPTKFVETQPNQLNPMTNPGNAPRMAALPGSGQSYINSSNYQTTVVDESRDETRLPATDASSVRAPAQFYPTGNAPQYPQANAYSGSTVMVNGQPTSYPGQPTAYQGQPVLVNPAGPANPYPGNSPPTVLAQSTTSAGGPNNSQLGWRTRERDSDGVNRF